MNKLLEISQSVGKTSYLKLTDIIDIDILQKLQDGFAESYDVASLIFDDKGKPITKPSNFSDFCKIIRATTEGLKKCEMSDATLSRLIDGGLSAIAPCSNFKEIQDGSVPLFIGSRRVATWGIGQKLINELSEEKVRSYATEIGANADQLAAAAKKLKIGSKKQFEKAVSFLETVAGYISLLGLQNMQLSREITKRKQTEKKLDRLSNDREEIFQALGHATIILDPYFNITSANRAVAEATGKSQEELIGKKCYKIFHNTDQPPEGCPANQILNSSRYNQCAAEMKALGRLFIISCTPVFGNDGKIERIIHAFTDITDQKHAEDVLIKKNKELEAFNKIAVDRELKMVELKKEINALSAESGKGPKYKIVDKP